MRWLLGKYGADIGKDIPLKKKNQTYFWLLIWAIVFGTLFVLSYYF